jgi:ribonuclease HI
VSKSKFYVVWKGRKTGIFTSWDEASAQVHGFTGAQFKSFTTIEAAKQALAAGAGHTYSYIPKPKVQQARLLSQAVVLPSYSVDAACSGNPGLLEYRCVDTKSQEEIFRRGPFESGTNNVGEFLAVVETLMLCHEEGTTWPIYSDSVNALNWVKAKKARTNLVQNAQNAQLFLRLQKCEDWLRAHTYPNTLLKWQTPNWGENPADFGRK